MADSILLQRQALKRRSFTSYKLAPYVFISPFYILFTIFFLFPSLFALLLSMFSWNGIGDLEYIGFANYNRMFTDGVFWQAVGNTFIFASANLLLVVPLSLLLATALNSKLLRWRSVWRTMYFTPVVTSTVAVTLVFSIFYSRESGLLNSLLVTVGLQPVDWLGDTSAVKVALIVIIAWRSVGLLTIYFLAGLQGISQELYEAAAIDGANNRQRFLFITIPLLRPVILFVSVIVLISSLQIFDEARILTGGGPSNASLTLVQYLYTRGFERLRFGFASSVGTVLFLAVFVLSLVQLRVFRVFRAD